MTGKLIQTQTAVDQEVTQSPELRLPYLEAIRNARDGRTVVSFFASFYTESALIPEDADYFEEILCNTKVTKGITLILDAPGGDGLTAERIIQICRSYGKGNFETIVPARAKSAATMICLGSDRILMSPTSELGPIDPQVPLYFEGREAPEWVAAHYITKAYDELLEKATAHDSGCIEPFLQQLTNFDPVQIEQLRAATRLSEHIAVNALQTGMMRGKSEDEIRRCIQRFTNPELTMSHGRVITAEQAAECGLKIELIDLDSALWSAIRSLLVRSRCCLSLRNCDKLIETPEFSYCI